MLQDLQDECQVVKVGSLGERWVLIQHAEPWLLTVNSKQLPQSLYKSDRLRLLEDQHTIPFMRKRSKRGVKDETEEPAAKKLAVDQQESEDREGLNRSLSDTTTENPIEDKQRKEQPEEDNVDIVTGVERETQTQSKDEGENEAGQESAETQERQEEKRQLRPRKERTDEVYSPPTGSAEQDNE